MSKKLIIISFFSLFVIQLTGCSSYVFHKPKAISTKSIQLQNMTKLSKVSTKQTNVLFLFFPFSSPMDPRDIWDSLLKEAKEKGGNAVIDVQIRSDKSFALAFPPIFVINTEATGLAVRID